MGSVAERHESTEVNTHQDASVFTIPAVICVGGPTPSGGRVVHVGPAAGWMAPTGVMEWSHEVSVVARVDVSEQLCQELRLILPEHRVLAIKFPRSHEAAKSAPLLAVSADVSKSLVEHGVRVYTVGFDRISGGFFFFAEGGGKDPVSLQGDLFQAIAPSLEGGDSHGDINACLDGLVDRLLAEKSDGILSEVAVELAAALPRLAPAGAEMPELDAFERFLEENASKEAEFASQAKDMVRVLGKAALRGTSKVEIPLFQEAVRDTQPVLALEMAAGSSGKTAFVQLPARERWLVTGAFQKESLAAQDNAAEKKAAEEKAAAAKRAADKKAAEEKAAAEKRAAEKKAAEEKAAADKKAAEKAAADKKAAEKAAAQKAAAEKAAAEKRASEKKAEEDKGASKKASKKKSAQEKASKKKAYNKKKAAERKPDQVADEPETPEAIEKPAPTAVTTPEAKSNTSMYVGVAAVVVVLALVAIWALFLRK